MGKILKRAGLPQTVLAVFLGMTYVSVSMWVKLDGGAAGPVPFWEVYGQVLQFAPWIAALLCLCNVARAIWFDKRPQPDAGGAA